MPNGAAGGLVRAAPLCQSGGMLDTLTDGAILFKDHTSADLHGRLCDLGVREREEVGVGTRTMLDDRTTGRPDDGLFKIFLDRRESSVTLGCHHQY